MTQGKAKNRQSAATSHHNRNTRRDVLKADIEIGRHILRHATETMTRTWPNSIPSESISTRWRDNARR